MSDIHVSIEYLDEGSYRRLGLFHAPQDAAVLAGLAGQAVRRGGLAIPPRGLPVNASFETWLATKQRPSGKPIGKEELTWLRVAHRLGADASHLVVARMD